MMKGVPGGSFHGGKATGFAIDMLIAFATCGYSAATKEGLTKSIAKIAPDLTEAELKAVSKSALKYLDASQIDELLKMKDIDKLLKNLSNKDLDLLLKKLKSMDKASYDEAIKAINASDKSSLDEIYNKISDIKNISNGNVYRDVLSTLDLEGYEEFLKRTDGMFVSEKDAEIAFQQLLDRDFKAFAKNFDFSTNKDCAYFWSGDKNFASDIATQNGGTIMENTPGGRVIDNWDWLNRKFPAEGNWGTGNELDPQPLWQAVSKEYANNVKGKVTYVNQTYEGNVWLKDESTILDKLMNKGIVTEIDYYNKEYLINKILDEGAKGW